jgi:hypothetical protein
LETKRVCLFNLYNFIFYKLLTFFIEILGLNPRREITSFDINDQALFCVGKDPVTVTQDLPRLKRLSRNEPKEWLRRTQYLDSEAVYKTNKTTTMESR